MFYAGMQWQVGSEGGLEGEKKSTAVETVRQIDQ